MEASSFATHTVHNQAPPLTGYNLFTGDSALVEAVARYDGGWAHENLARFGARLGSEEVQEWGRLANSHGPVLRPFDRVGHRIDQVEFHPAYHALMTLALEQGLHSAPWADPKPGAHVARAAGVILQCQNEAGTQCPTTMTYGSVPTLKHHAALSAIWLPHVYDRRYDPTLAPIAQKRAVTLGMGMTEKQGGSDLRANSTRAELIDGNQDLYRLVGHKWFLSAPMSDAFLILAQSDDGLSCFFLPRILPDGTQNALHFQRLKDKLGNRSNASSEVEFHGALGWRIGEAGRGVQTIIEMGNYTRLDCALGSAGLTRAALAQALHHAAHRTAFQRRLVDQPMMRAVLADLALESEAATALAIRLAAAYDRQDDAGEKALRRLLTPAAKFWLCKRGPTVAAEAMEVLGGNGYVEESIMPRLYREMPVNSIWEGSGNIMVLDMLRAAQKSPEAMTALFAELDLAQGGNPHLDRAIGRLKQAIGTRIEPDEALARRVARDVILCLGGALLVRHAPAAIGDLFCASRLDGDGGGCFGILPGGDQAAVIARAMPTDQAA